MADGAWLPLSLETKAAEMRRRDNGKFGKPNTTNASVSKLPHQQKLFGVGLPPPLLTRDPTSLLPTPKYHLMPYERTRQTLATGVVERTREEGCEG